MDSLPKIALVGRPNVGKSTLFNRLIGRRQAIVDDIPGVTRDRQYGESEWSGVYFTVIDTGGFVPGAEADDLAKAVRDQVGLALAEADAVVLVVDGRFGLTPAEEEIARWLRKQKPAVFLAVNKVDTANQENLLAEFLKLGFPHTVGISAETGRGMSDLLDTLLPVLQNSKGTEASTVDLKLTILGQPNVGKSTLLNRLLGEDRAVVHHQAGTTLDPLKIQIQYEDHCFELVDTAGIQRRRQTQGKIAKVGVIKALQIVKQSHLVLLMVDATHGLTAQDAKLINQAVEAGRAVILVFNKWDLMPVGSTLKQVTEKLHTRLKRLEYIPVIALSAKSGRGIPKLFKLITKIADNFRRHISTGELNRTFGQAIQSHPHPTSSGQHIQLNYITQLSGNPPRFLIFCNRPRLVKEDYLRYLERVFRKKFELTGVPVKWSLRKKS